MVLEPKRISSSALFDQTNSSCHQKKSDLIIPKMSKTETQDNLPPPGYPTESPPPAKKKKKGFFRTKKRGEKGFIEGCLAALCCCWICETCCL